MRLVVLPIAALLILGHQTARAQSCPSALYLGNHNNEPNGMQGNGAWVGYGFVQRKVSNGGAWCSYSRSNHGGFEELIGRDLGPGEVSATPTAPDSWWVCTANGSCYDVSCPANITLGPVEGYADSNGAPQFFPTSWGWATSGGSQVVPFFSAGAPPGHPPVFALQCNYSGFQNVSLYVPSRSFLPSVCTGLYSANGPLSSHLQRCLGLEDQLVWEDGTGNLYNYSGYGHGAWTQAQKDRLDQIFAAIESGAADLGLDCPSAAKDLWSSNQSNDANGNPIRSPFPVDLMFTANQAFDTYAASVAWILYLEIHQRVPWSIFHHPLVELQEFFDSRRYHTRFPLPGSNTAGYTSLNNYPTNIAPGRDFWNAQSRREAAWEAVCDPRIGYQFLTGQQSSQKQSLLGTSEQATLKNMTGWFYSNVAHGQDAGPTNLRTDSTDYILNNHYIYLSNRLQARNIPVGVDGNGNVQYSTHPLVYANLGCHSAANLFYDLAKSVNIPLLHVASDQPDTNNYPVIFIDNGRHSGLVYGWGDPSTTLILQHTDDIYANYGMLFPIDSAGKPVADLAQALFAATWLSPSQLSAWGYSPTNDYSPQTPNSTYGDPQLMQVEDDGIFAGYWLPTSTPANANVSRFSWGNQVSLCSFDGTYDAMFYCTLSTSDIENVWQHSFGQTIISWQNGSINSSAALSHLQSCAVAYTQQSPSTACGYLVNPSSSYSNQLNNRVASNYWVGPLGQ
jgi:hypothetical protein